MRIGAAVLVILSFAASAAAQTRIRGIIYDDVTGTPVEGVSVNAYDTEGRFVAASSPFLHVGGYEIVVPGPGAYHLKTVHTTRTYVPQLRLNHPCIAEDCVVTSGDSVNLSANGVVDFRLLRAGRITGTVRRTDTGAPIGGARIHVYNQAGSRITDVVSITASDGTYTFDGLAGGTYFAGTETQSGNSSSLNLLDELYGGQPCPTIPGGSFGCRVLDGAAIIVGYGATTSGIDFSLDRGGSISGRVADASGNGLGSVRVAAYAGDRIVAVADTSSGEYTIGSLPPGTYAVQAGFFTGEYRREWYDDKCVACGDRPTPVTVTAGTDTTAINFVLSRGGSIEGTVTYAPPDGMPLGPPQIFVYNQGGTLVETRSFEFGASGTSFQYRVDGLPSGTYYVKAWDQAFPPNVLHVPPRVTPARGRLVGELFDNIVCVAANCRPTSGTPVQVVSGQVARGVDFALDVGGTITGSGFRGIDVFDARGVLLPERLEFGGSTIVGLPPGTYYLRRKRDPSSAEQLYRDIDTCVTCPPTFGTPVVVAKGQNVTGVDFTDQSGRAIYGFVRDAGSMAPLANVLVEAFAADGRLIGSAISSFGGTYRLTQLAPGAYYLRTVNTRNYVDQVYDGLECSGCPATLGRAVMVIADEDVEADFALTPGTPVGGTVTSTDGLWLPGARVSLFDASGALAARASAGALGSYSVTLPPGSYRARVDPVPGYVQELFNDLPCPAGACDVTTGTPIPVTTTAITNISFSLASCVAPSISPLRLATGAVGLPYRQTFGAAGGTPPRRFYLASGVLPPGLTLDAANGGLSGAPTASGSYAVTMAVVDGSGCGGTREYTIDVHPCGFDVSRTLNSLRARGEPGIILVANACGTWTATTDAPWIRIDAVTPDGVFFAAMPNPGPGSRSATILVGPRAVTVYQSAPEATPPFGFVDIPQDGVVVDGAIAIGGWALDDLGVFAVRVYRNSVSPEPPGQRIFLGTAVFVEGARPDVEQLYPALPGRRRAGWGFMLLTNMLPDILNGRPSGGNGTFQISAYAVDGDLTETLLGTRTIVVNNATATSPFGTIDTPAQGERISGADYINFGWVLTPQPKSIPRDGSTIRVYLDGAPLGTVSYNFSRPDIAALFPGYANSDGAVGFRMIDTTALDDGQHTISWTGSDSTGATAGIGSRYFIVSNSAPGTTSSIASGVSASMRAAARAASAALPVTIPGLDLGRRAASLDRLPEGDGGVRTLTMRSVERAELRLEPGKRDGCQAAWAGYHVVAGETTTLPAGASLDASGIFYWHPGPAFLGTYDLVFVRTGCDGSQERVAVSVRIEP